MLMIAIRTFVLAVALWAVCTPAFAYVDPNAGGYLFQFLMPVMAAIAGATFYLKSILSRMRSRFSSWIRKKG